MNVRALQEVMDAQTLAYVFPFSQFSFPTDISCIILAEGRKSAFFKTELNIPLRARTDPAGIAKLYKPADHIRMPPQETLAAFRDLVVGARCGKVQVSEETSEVCFLSCDVVAGPEDGFFHSIYKQSSYATGRATGT